MGNGQGSTPNYVQKYLSPCLLKRALLRWQTVAGFRKPDCSIPDVFKGRYIRGRSERPAAVDSWELFITHPHTHTHKHAPMHRQTHMHTHTNTHTHPHTHTHKHTHTHTHTCTHRELLTHTHTHTPT